MARLETLSHTISSESSPHQNLLMHGVLVQRKAHPSMLSYSVSIKMNVTVTRLTTAGIFHKYVATQIILA